MVRIWAKLLKDGKIVRQCVYEHEGVTDYSIFYEYVRDICSELDLPTPVLIKVHLFNYAKYNTVKFTKSDFVEDFPFDKLILENALL